MFDNEKEAWDNACEKSIHPTAQYIAALAEKQDMIIISQYPTINDKVVSLEKKDGYFFLLTDLDFNNCPDPVRFQDKAYGFYDSFNLKDRNGNIYNVPTGVDDFEPDFSRNQIRATIKHLDSFSSDKSFFRYITQHSFTGARINSFVEGEFLKDEEGLDKSLVKIKCGAYEIDTFFASVHEKYFIVFDSCSQITFSEFNSICECIIYSFGFISGEIIRDERYILESDSFNFKSIKRAWYKLLPNSIISDSRVLWPRLQKEYNKEEKYLSKNIFSHLITSAYQNKGVFRSLKIICEAHSYPVETKAAAYSVALETIKNIINDENAEKFSPFRDKKSATEIISALLNTLNSFTEDYFKSKEALINKINQLRQRTNVDSFKLSYSYYGVELNELDLACLQTRNDFLHGRLPFENEKSDRAATELKYTTFRMHQLASILILKYCGFSGYIANLPKIASLQHKDKEINEEPFRKI